MNGSLDGRAHAGPTPPPPPLANVQRRVDPRGARPSLGGDFEGVATAAEVMVAARADVYKLAAVHWLPLACLSLIG